ncbi:MAG: class I SAM-dependent methyltransferase [Candidatus Heimdallarchaeota archaeon]|nr:class I SAM-dependent methyltransferase [Candidatus Heimdallarchaeota archaeon]
MTSSEYVACFYCSEYAKVATDYPQNFASQDKDTFTPRCFLHWKFECHKCGKETHFNGIAWCSDCEVFTCLRCAEEKMVRKEFLIYDYYYNIPCHKCNSPNPALDFAEYYGKHPFQIGDLIPKEDIVIWMPIYKEDLESQEFPHKSWGSERILDIGNAHRHTRLDSSDEYNPESVWDKMAENWISPETEGEYHHTTIILPEVYRLLEAQKDEKILDVACGEGTVARYLAKIGVKVTGIDISKMIERAIGRENEDKLGISYVKMAAEDLSKEFEKESFDKVVCNMALMDIEDYKTTIKKISYVLKKDGTFVFSITHPAFAWPTTTSMRVPPDSQRNEDKRKIALNYFDERPTLIQFGWDTPSLAFTRPVSKYVNELVKNNLEILEMSEPEASKEIVEKYPRQAYLDNDTLPDFLMIKAKKK